MISKLNHNIFVRTLRVITSISQHHSALPTSIYKLTLKCSTSSSIPFFKTFATSNFKPKKEPKKKITQQEYRAKLEKRVLDTIHGPINTLNRPSVALIGRPNVGKSTIFNKLIEGDQRKALVNPTPGTTRDRAYGNAIWLGREYLVIDTGGLVGEIQGSKDETNIYIKKQAELAMIEAHTILFIVDIKEGLTPTDKQIAKYIRSNLKDKKVIVVVNKADNDYINDPENLAPFKRLGLGNPMPISATHSIGIADLLDEVIKDLPANSEEDTSDPEPQKGKPASVRVAIIGKPNVGKSSILNSILKSERSVVSEIPGTTHDPVDSTIEWNGEKVTLIDTAGIRKGAMKEKSLEKLTIMWALRVVEKSHVSIFVIDPENGVTQHDMSIASHIQQHFKSAIIVVNKWDKLRDKEGARREYSDHIRAQLKFMDYVPVHFTSAKTGYMIKELMDLVLEVFAERSFRFKTKELMDIIKSLPAQHGSSPSKGKRKLKLKFAVQADLYPPTFTLFVNDPNLVHFSYERYLENSLREKHKFIGTPIRFLWRQNVGKQKMESQERKKYRNQKKDQKKEPTKMKPKNSQREVIEQ